MKAEPQFELYQGRDLTFTSPSGHVFTIREQNGDDDETLTSIDGDKKEENIKNLNLFLSSIIRENTVNNKKHLTIDEVNELKLKDKYYILLKSRLHSIGNNLRFGARCPKKDCKHETIFKEDLTKYDTDLSTYNPEAEKYKYQITPYPAGKDLTKTLTLSSGRKVRYTYLNVGAEYGISKQDKISQNSELYARSLALYNPQTQQYETLGSFNVFSKKDMIELGKEIEDNDQQFMMFMELECQKCGFKWEVPFLYLKDFFFPGEI